MAQSAIMIIVLVVIAVLYTGRQPRKGKGSTKEESLISASMYLILLGVGLALAFLVS